MNTMNYNGYTARVEYDERDDIFVGRILGLKDIISFHADNTTTLREELSHAVDDYLDDCKRLGVEPEKAASGKLMLRVPPEVHGMALISAQASGKSLNLWATEVIREAAYA